MPKMFIDVLLNAKSSFIIINFYKIPLAYMINTDTYFAKSFACLSDNKSEASTEG